MKYSRLKSNSTCSLLSKKSNTHIYPCDIFITYELYALNRRGTLGKDKLTKENSGEENYKGRRLLSKKMRYLSENIIINPFILRNGHMETISTFNNLNNKYKHTVIVSLWY